MYDSESFEQGLGEISACRYDGVEMSLGMAEAVGPDAVAEGLDEYGLELYFLMGGFLESESIVDDIAAGAETAADLGSEFLGILPPQRGLIEDDDLLEEWIIRVCEAAEDAGVTPLLHHHGATHIESPAETEAWLGRSPDNLGLLWDTAHHYPYGENYPDGDVTDGIERFADDIEYVHLKDVRPKADFDDHTAALTSGEFNLGNVILYYNAMIDLGEGVIDFEGVRDALEEIGYDGNITIEVEIERDDTLVHAKRNIDYWNDVLGRA